MTDSVLKVDSLSKRFGKIQAVNNLSINIKKGQVFGILGPNGSGKTTTLGMLLDVVAPTSGSYEWFGGMKPADSRKQIGSILETPCFYPYLNAVQNLRIAAHIKGCSFDRIETVLKIVNLFDRSTDPFRTFSLGMKQRLSIAAALLADPPVLILDEPTNGLDPQGIAEIRTLIKDIASEGKTILIASHLLDEVQKVCSDFIVLKKGNKLHEGSVQDILGEKREVLIDGPDRKSITKIFSSYSDGEIIEDSVDGLLVQLNDKGSAFAINKFCFDHGVTLTKLLTMKRSLEEEFMKILNEN
ncbi:MAG: ABC-2 type transport system ATP-binding protein [Cyclobacteriaceae bacterium]|jgi:ABC-type multidrug transport system ATPase subunit